MEEPPPPPAPEAPSVPCPYLLSFDAFSRIFEKQTSTGTTRTTAERVQMLQEALGVKHVETNPRTAAWIDFCFGVLCFARDEDAHFETDEKVLLVVTIANDIFQFATTMTITTEEENTINGEKLLCLPSVQSCYEKFRERIREVSCTQPPTPPPPAAEQPTVLDEDDVTMKEPSSSPSPPPPMLSTSDVASFVAFMSTTFFRHLRAYQYLFTHTRESVTREIELFVETPFPPTPLAAATLLLDP